MDKKALEEQFEEFARWYVLPLDKSEDGIYRALETQSAWMSFQHQQAKVDELQKQLSEYIFVSETLDEMYVKEVQKSDELQKRMDKAIRLLVEAELYQSEPNIDLAVKALKGEG